MPRFRLPLTRSTIAAILFTCALGITSAQDDAAKAAAQAEKQRGDIQKKLAAGTDLQKRLRLDKFEAADKTVKVTGVFLDIPPAKADDPVPFDQVTDALFKSLRNQLKQPTLKFDARGIVRIPFDQHPHVVLQLAANAAARRGMLSPMSASSTAAGSTPPGRWSSPERAEKTTRSANGSPRRYQRRWANTPPCG